MLTSSQKWLVILGAAIGFLSVAFGAFGAHALKQKLTHARLDTFEIGVRYQMYHALAMLVSVWLSTLFPGSLMPFAGWLFFTGILVFSGSLYLLVLTDISIFGAVTPIGGVFFLLGWGCLALAVLRS